MSPVAGRPSAAVGTKLIVPFSTGWPLYLTVPETGYRLESPDVSPQPRARASPIPARAAAARRVDVLRALMTGSLPRGWDRTRVGAAARRRRRSGFPPERP